MHDALHACKYYFRSCVISVMRSLHFYWNEQCLLLSFCWSFRWAAKAISDPVYVVASEWSSSFSSSSPSSSSSDESEDSDAADDSELNPAGCLPPRYNCCWRRRLATRGRVEVVAELEGGRLLACNEEYCRLEEELSSCPQDPNLAGGSKPPISFGSSAVVDE